MSLTMRALFSIQAALLVILQVEFRESAFLGVPSVNIGTRQSGRERGPNVIDVDDVAVDIEKAARAQIKHGRYGTDNRFGMGDAGVKIAASLAEINVEIQKTMAF